MQKPQGYLTINQQAWNRMVDQQDRLTRPAEDREFVNPLKTVDPCGWLGSSIAGQRVLCLAAGGGRQAPLYAAAGGRVTVVDLSSKMLDLDRSVARQRNLSLETIETSMGDLSMLGDDSFDLVIHPVSTCYLPDVKPVYREIARVLKGEGLYISQHKQPASLQAPPQTADGNYSLEHPYYRTTPLPPVNTKNLVRELDTLEYLHRWEELLGEMCRAGFWIEDLLEPVHADPSAAVHSFEYRSVFLPAYVRIKARRRQKPPNSGQKIWIPQ
jgi:ubiquinone/menaquinone biosynthesis C-methylase UbiE